MNKKVLLGFVIAFLVIGAVAMAGCTGTDTQKTYVVGIDVYEPYSYTDTDGNITGFDVECMKWIANDAGYNVTFEYIDWDAMATYLDTGKRDIICSGLSITDERKEAMDFTNPYWTISIGVVGLADSTATMEDFYAGNVKIGVQQGCSSDEGLEGWLGEELYSKMKAENKIVNTYSTFALAMQDLKNKRVDVVIFDDAGIQTQIANNPGVFKLIGTVEGTEEEFAASVKKGNSELLKILNDGYAKLMASEDWDKLVEKFGL